MIIGPQKVNRVWHAKTDCAQPFHLELFVTVIFLRVIISLSLNLDFLALVLDRLDLDSADRASAFSFWIFDPVLDAVVAESVAAWDEGRLELLVFRLKADRAVKLLVDERDMVQFVLWDQNEHRDIFFLEEHRLDALCENRFCHQKLF